MCAALRLLKSTEAEDESLCKFLTSQYKVTGKIGQGGYANIYKAKDKAGNMVAIKVVARSRNEDQIKNEIRIMRRLNHDNCARFVDSRRTDSHIALVMTYGDRGDLFEYLFPSDFELGCRPVSEKQALRIFVLLTLGLEHLHSQNIVHRDLKPENIFLDTAMNVIIGDFGLSIPFDPIGERRCVNTGTLHYTPPESVRRVPVRGPEVDVWSSGVILYEMLFGCYPFYGRDNKEVLRRIDCEPAEIYGGISDDTGDLLARLLNKNPTKRISIPNIKRHPAVRSMFLNSDRLNISQESPRGEPAPKLTSLPLDRLPRCGTSQEPSPRTRTGEYTPGRTPRSPSGMPRRTFSAGQGCCSPRDL